MGDSGISGSGVHIETPNGTFAINIRNNNCYFLFLAPFSLGSCWRYDKPKYSGSCGSITPIWFPSHRGVSGNEKADSLRKSVTADTLRGNACLVLVKLSSIKMIELNSLWMITPAHPWYFGKRHRWCHQLNIPKKQQTAASRFFSDHIKSLTFPQGRKVFPEHHRCEAVIRPPPIISLIA
ncbi:hypothetical protein TNCV_2452731 [Trichonephila clavipes]|nr:hypothetical protein TNCV_2452731 [Trichonephila clavipes]